jgi:ArsR family transcriptional regulator
MSISVAADARWHLYRILADPVRLRLLALTAEMELSVGELADLLEQTQPNLSRHAGPLRAAGLVSDRRDGTRILLRLTAGAASDPVVADALAEGRRLCEEDGSLARAADLVRARDARTREYFATEHLDTEPEGGDLAAYLHALGGLLPRRGVAVDAGTGDGTVLEALAPLFERVVAIDRSQSRLERARRRMIAREYTHVEFVQGEVDSPEVRRAVGGGADVVVAGRMLHHAPVPARMVRALSDLLAPGGRLLVVDYAAHSNESLREAQADVWLGFEAEELVSFATQAGLAGARVVRLPADFWGGARRGRVERLPWLALAATKPTVSEANHPARSRRAR